MNSLKWFLLVFALLLAGCSAEMRNAETARVAETKKDSLAAQKETTTEQITDPQEPLAKASFGEAEKSQSMTEAMDRKIIKTAELRLEVASPIEIQRQIGSIAEGAGGFVVNSEVKQQEVADPAKQQLEVALVVRVPVSKFDLALNQIRGTASRIIDDKISGQDVTEEFIDLEARIKTQKALEAQFLEIMKQARKVSDALEVQSQIAEVRTDIERLEGRKRFLENRAGLSTITVTLRTPSVIVVNTSSFGRSVKEAVVTSVDLGTNIVLGLIQFAIVSAPVLLLIVLPGGLIARYFVRRSKRHQLARELESVPSTN